MDEPTTDAGIGPALGDAGVCPTITFNGKSWVMGHPTQKAKLELELLVIEAVQVNIDDAKRALGPAKYQAKCDKLDLQIEAGAYKTGGELWNAVNNGPKGQALFLTSLLRERHPDVTLAEGLAMWRGEQRQVRRALALTVPDFFSILADDLPLTPEEKVLRKAEMATAFLEAINEPQQSPTPAASTV